METKQTAVDLIHNFIDSSCGLYGSRITLNPDLLFDCINKAKQMEKEQMIEFADRYGFDVCHFDYDRAEEYYERTYKQQDNEN